MQYPRPEIGESSSAMDLIQSAAAKSDPFWDSPVLQTYATSAAYEADE